MLGMGGAAPGPPSHMAKAKMKMAKAMMAEEISKKKGRADNAFKGMVTMCNL